MTLYGFTKNESTSQYLLVLTYYENGDLRKRLRHQATNWYQKKNIHSAGMIHR